MGVYGAVGEGALIYDKEEGSVYGEGTIRVRTVCMGIGKGGTIVESNAIRGASAQRQVRTKSCYSSHV